MKVIRKKCWKCKGAGFEINLLLGQGFVPTMESKACSVCRGSGRIEIKQDRIK